MKASARAIGAVAAVAVTLPAHMLLILSGGTAALVLLVYIGIVLPAVWSAKPARRKGAAVLHQVLYAAPGKNADEGQPPCGRGEYTVKSPACQFIGDQQEAGALEAIRAATSGRLLLVVVRLVYLSVIRVFGWLVLLARSDFADTGPGIRDAAGGLATALARLHD